MIRTTLVALVLMLGVPVARAQDEGLPPPGVPRIALDAREVAYGRALAAKLGAPEGRVSPVALRWAPSGGQGTDGMVANLADGTSDPAPVAARPPVEVRGVRVDARGLVVKRLRFPSAADALEYAAFEAHVGSGPTVLQLRGAQLLLVEGQGARDATRARSALAAAWQGLPAPGEVEATYAALGEPGELAFTTTHTSGPLAAAITSVLESARRHSRTAPETFSWNGPADVTVTMLGGMRARAHQGPSGGWLWCTMKPERAEATRRYLERLLGAPLPAEGGAVERPVTGAAQRLEGAFGR